MSYDSCLEFLELFTFVHGGVGSEDDDDMQNVFNHLDLPPLSKVHALKDLGNDLFRQNQFIDASSCYDKACGLLCFALNDKFGLDKNCVLHLAISLCLNLAACAIKLQAFQGALIFCSMVLNFFPRNAKGLFRKAVALKSLNKFSEAQVSLEEAVLVEPHNRDILRELEEIKKLQAIKPNGKRVVDRSLDATDIRIGKRSASTLEIRKTGMLEEVAEIVHPETSKLSASNVDSSSLENMDLGSASICASNCCDKAESCCSSSKLNIDYIPCSNQDVEVQGNLHVVADAKFQPLVEVGGEASSSKGILLNNEMDCDNIKNSGISDVVMEFDSNAQSCPRSLGLCASHLPAAKSTKYSFSNKKQSDKNLCLSSKDYENLMLGKNLQFYHPMSGAFMKVRPLFTKPSILTGTPHEKSSWEAAVPSSSPLPMNLCLATDFRVSDDLKISVDEAVSRLNVKRPRLSQKESPISNNNSVCEVATIDCTPTKHSMMDDSSPMPSQTCFVFSALTMYAGRRRSNSRGSVNHPSSNSRYVNHPSVGHRMGGQRAQLKNKSLLLVRSSVFCRFTKTKTLEVDLHFKRKHECSIHFDNPYDSPLKKRRLCVNGSSYTSTYASFLSTSLGVSLGPRFVL